MAVGIDLPNQDAICKQIKTLLIGASIRCADWSIIHTNKGAEFFFKFIFRMNSIDCEDNEEGACRIINYFDLFLFNFSLCIVLLKLLLTFEFCCCTSVYFVVMHFR